MINLLTNILQQKKWLLLSLLFAFSLNTEASHFRYGSISWQKVNNSTNQVQFKVSTAWRRWANQQVGQSLSIGTIRFGDGSTATINATVLSAQGNSSTGWFYSEAIINHTYPATTQNYTADFTGCCRIGNLLGGAANGNWNVQTVVNVGTNNNGPVTTVSPIVNVQTGLSAATFNVPVADPDGDNIQYRLANSSELGGVSNPSGISVNASTGQVSMNTIGRPVGSLWAVGIVGEDLDASGNVQSKVLADFMVQIVQQSNPPFFTGATPADGTTYQVSPGQNVNFTVEATDSDPGSTVTLNAIGSPIGAIGTQLPTTANPVAVNFNWTPTPGDVGTTVVNFTATDNNGVQVSTSASIIVSMKPQFDIPPTPATTAHIDVAPGQTITYTVQASDPDPLDVVVINEVYGKDMSGNEIPLYANASFTPLPLSPGNPTSGTFTWNTQSSDWGHKHVYFYAEDSYGDKTRHEVSQLINTVPVFTSTPAVTTITVGSQFLYNITVSDPDLAYGDQLTIFDIAKPAWLTFTDIGNGSATLSGVPQLSDVGSYNIEIEAQDINHHQNPGGIPRQQFTLTVNPCNLSLSISAVQNETCEDATDGAIAVNLLGANDPVSYSWSNSETTANISNLDAGTYTLNVEDAYGCTETISATVETVDNIPPVVAVQNLSISLDENGSATITAQQIDNASTDACGVASLTLDKSTFDCDDLGENIITLTATDVNGNSSSATATVTVVDNTAPTVIAQDITVQLDAAGNASITAADLDNGSSDACGIASLAIDKSVFNCANVGANTVVLTVTDNNGNASAATATVNVEDNVAPVAAAQDLTIQLDAAGNASITAADIDNGSSDACGIASMALDNSDFNCANVGANTVVLTVTDNNGNTSTATATVNVEDNVAPVAAAQDLTIQLDAAGNASITSADVDNGSSDACGIASLALDITDFNCANVGANTVILTVTDNNGNTSTTTATVTVEDNVAPAVVTQDLTVQLDASGNAIITTAQIDNGSSDACGIASIELDKSSFDCSNAGANTVTLTVTDNNTNVSFATATVTVEDKVAPVAISQNLIVQLDAAGNASISAEQVDNGSSDACGIASLALDNTDFDCTNVGANTVTLTVTDNNSNVSTATAQITVEDNVAPNVLTSSIVIQLDASGQASIAVPDIDNGSSDACGIASMNLRQTDFDCSHAGINTVTLTATDINGNTATADAAVTVEDNVKPIVVTSDMIVALDENGNAAITADDINNGSSDACGISSLSLDQMNFDCSHVGNNTVSLTVVDVHGNEASATAVVTVTNDLPEITSLSLPVDPLEFNELVALSATYSDLNLVSASVDWGDDTQSPAIVSGGAIEATHVYPNSDLYTVTLTITDICGETDSDTFQYIIVTNSNDGHVHGDGYVWSNMGNYLYNPTSEGKAKYKFDIEYKKKKVHDHKKGKQHDKHEMKKGKEDNYVYELDGKAEFKFKEGKLEFKSEELDWLVVSSQMAFLKGSGKLNKIQGYEFIISAIEVESKKKDEDMFRIKIWSADNGTVVYDNLMGADIDSESIPQILKGKVHIHKPKKKKDDKDDKEEKYDEDNTRIAANIELEAEILETKVDAYPNPFQDVLSIRHSGNIADKHIELTMRDISGRVVYTKSYNPYFQSEVNLDFGGEKVKQGIYLIHIDDGDNSKILKLIKK